MTPDIFLSYNREDQAAARRFAEAFEAQGFSVWWDVTLRSGEAYDEVTEEALKSAKAVVVLWSQKSVVSRWVRAEATLADRNETLVPARIEACDLPIMFELTQTADLSHWSGDAKDLAWRNFLTDVRRFMEAGGVPRPPVVQASSNAAASPQNTRASLAVLPFINRSGLKEDDVFAEGMAQDLSAALTASHLVRVVASRATATYRTGTGDLRQIGRDIGVRYLLEGNVRRVGNNVRVTAQLVEAESDSILWTQKFDRPITELAALQDDLVTEVAAHLRVQVERAEIEHAVKKPGNISSWEALMRAWAHMGSATRSGYEAAGAEIKRAVEIDPNDGAAHARLAAFRGHLLHVRGGDRAEAAQEITRNIERARALDPNSSEVGDGIATALAWLRKAQDAVPYAERSVGMNPNDVNSRLILGSVLVRAGRADQGIEQLNAVERLAPNSIWVLYSTKWRSVAHLQAGRLEQALEAVDQALHRLHDSDSLIQSALCLAKSNRIDGARDTVRRLRDTDPEMSRSLVENIVRDLYCGSNAADEHVAIARKLWDDVSNEPSSP